MEISQNFVAFSEYTNFNKMAKVWFTIIVSCVTLGEFYFRKTEFTVSFYLDFGDEWHNYIFSIRIFLWFQQISSKRTLQVCNLILKMWAFCHGNKTQKVKTKSNFQFFQQKLFHSWEVSWEVSTWICETS